MAPDAVAALGIVEAGGQLVPLEIRRREPGPRDVVLELEYCGVCACDVHAGRGERGFGHLPLVPGHQMVGIVSATGAGAADLGIGSRVGVGAWVDSCRDCAECRAGRAPSCTRKLAAYGGHDPRTGGYTQGGYSRRIVVGRDFVLPLPGSLDPAAAAPLFCAGTQAYSALQQHRVGPGSTVGVLGLGWQGQLAVKLAVAMGARVSVLSRGSTEREAALGLGAAAATDTQDRAGLRAAQGSLDLLLDAVPAPHEAAGFLACLRGGGALVRLSPFAGPAPAPNTREPVSGRPGPVGSLVGSIAETRELLDLCAEHHVECAIELVNARDANAAWDRLARADTTYGFVLDLATLGGNN